MSNDPTVKLCILSSSLEQDWRDLYSTAFPSSEREPESKLQNHINTGKLLYHKSTGKNGELLAFSMVSLAADFSLLAYIAVDPKHRSGGYGSKHMKALLAYMQQHYPKHTGLVLEIESTAPKKSKLSDDEKNLRQRRFGFYRRLGARRLCRSMQYLVPSKSGQGELELDLVYFNFQSSEPDSSTKKHIAQEVLERFYELKPDDPLVLAAVASIAPCPQHKSCGQEQDCQADSAILEPENGSDKQSTSEPASSKQKTLPAATGKSCQKSFGSDSK